MEGVPQTRDDCKCVSGLVVPPSGPPPRSPAIQPCLWVEDARGSRCRPLPFDPKALRRSRLPAGERSSRALTQLPTPHPTPQGQSRSAKRTSSGVGTSAASPRCGGATRTTTARTTATRMTAVSGQLERSGRGWGHRAGGAGSVRAWLQPRGPPAPSLAASSGPQQGGRRIPVGPGAEPRVVCRGLAWPGGWAGTRGGDAAVPALVYLPAIRPSLGPTGRVRVPNFHAAAGRTALLFRLFFFFLGMNGLPGAPDWLGRDHPIGLDGRNRQSWAGRCVAFGALSRLWGFALAPPGPQR